MGMRYSPKVNRVLPPVLDLAIVLHVLRNPWGWTADDVRRVRQWAADVLEYNQTVINLPDDDRRGIEQAALQIWHSMCLLGRPDWS